ncbi:MULTISPECIES: hypothetical protein [Pseudomonas]|uniref:hypothetical protein n=1 Tax=Pseudomonas TaxID=286 RepID=UPI0025958EA0|nr:MULTISPECIES: hypothetical protein [Pseudomonas]
MSVMSEQVGAELLEALGLQGMPITAVTVHFEASQAVEIQVKFYANKDQAEDVIEILKRYELHEKVE